MRKQTGTHGSSLTPRRPGYPARSHTTLLAAQCTGPKARRSECLQRRWLTSGLGDGISPKEEPTHPAGRHPPIPCPMAGYVPEASTVQAGEGSWRGWACPLWAHCRWGPWCKHCEPPQWSGTGLGRKYSAGKHGNLCASLEHQERDENTVLERKDLSFAGGSWCMIRARSVSFTNISRWAQVGL